jgi:hypothetical protein
VLDFDLEPAGPLSSPFREFPAAPGDIARRAVSDFLESFAPSNAKAAGAPSDKLEIAALGFALDRVHAHLAQMGAFGKRNDFIEPPFALAISLGVWGGHVVLSAGEAHLKVRPAIQSTAR